MCTCYFHYCTLIQFQVMGEMYPLPFLEVQYPPLYKTRTHAHPSKLPRKRERRAIKSTPAIRQPQAASIRKAAGLPGLVTVVHPTLSGFTAGVHVFLCSALQKLINDKYLGLSVKPRRRFRLKSAPVPQNQSSRLSNECSVLHEWRYSKLRRAAVTNMLVMPHMSSPHHHASLHTSPRTRSAFCAVSTGTVRPTPVYTVHDCAPRKIKKTGYMSLL